jgi:hypothetical protein
MVAMVRPEVKVVHLCRLRLRECSGARPPGNDAANLTSPDPRSRKRQKQMNVLILRGV